MTQDEFWDWIDTCPGEWDQWNMRSVDGQITVTFFVNEEEE